MTDLDRAAQPAKDYEYRAYHSRTRDVIMLEQPELIKYHDGYQLQKRGEDGKWAAASLNDTHPEDVSE